jgi:hypothetical protein
VKPLGGQPAPDAKPSVSDPDELVGYWKAFKAAVWSQPAMGVYRIRRGMFALGMKNNETLAMSHALHNHFRRICDGNE